MRRCLVLCLVIVTLAPPRVLADEDAPSAAGASSSSGRRERRAPRAAPADEPPRGPAPPPATMRALDVSEIVVSSIVSAGVVATAFAPLPGRTRAQWRGGILFDDAVRGGMRLGAPSDRDLASTLSDALVGGLILAPPLLDAALTAWLVRGDPELMGRMLLIDLQAHAFAQGLTTIFKRAVGRERPVTRACREHPDQASADPSCAPGAPENLPASFFSGHASLAFTSAALVCLHHTELGLLGPEGDAAACATGLALATTVGLLRIAADQHYATDVLVGAGVGLLSGWLLPWLLHYDVGEAVGAGDATSITIAPRIDDDVIGLQVFGVF